MKMLELIAIGEVEANRRSYKNKRRINELGYQYLKKGDLEASLAAFRYNREQYPGSPNVWDSLGDALDRAGKKDEALASYRKAVSLAEANGDPNIKHFRDNVTRLEGAKPDPQLCDGSCQPPAEISDFLESTQGKGLASFGLQICLGPEERALARRWPGVCAPSFL